MKNCDKRKEITVLTNLGSLIFDRKGRLRFSSLNVRMNDNSIETIISLKYVNKISGVCVTIYISMEKEMNLILRNGTVLKFKECGTGLYYYDMGSAYVQDSDKTTQQ